MAWRVREDDLDNIILVADADGTISAATRRAMSAAIDAANVLTDRVETEDSSSVLTAAELIQIEKYLAAHFLACHQQQYANKATEGASATFQGQFKTRLDSTDFGQRAILLDASGYLASLSQEGGRQKVSAAWLGRPVSAQTEYEDRD